jgi:hypothetical protein
MKENRLIAEFMKYPDLGTKGDFSYLKYHTSWDWLMPVVDKIESFTDDNKLCKYNVNIEQWWVEIIDNQTSDEIVFVDGNDKILATYKAVVEFIKQIK